MFFFLKLALGNVIKNSRNTAAILTVVIICVFFMQFTVGYMEGFRLKLVNDSLVQTGHITVFNKEFYDNLDFAPVEMNMTHDRKTMDSIKSVAGVLDIRPEINFGAVANTETDSKESRVKAIDPSVKSAAYDKRRTGIKEGEFIKGDRDMLIGVKMARSLKAKVGDSLILMSMDQHGSINAVEGRICGIFRNYNPVEEEGLVICSLAMAQKLLAIDGRVTEMVINTDNYKTAKQTADSLNDALGNGSIRAVPWQEEMAYLVPMLDMMDVSIAILMGIIIFVAGMGITNSFLMNIMGRLPEFGVLRAMGLGTGQMFGMIMAESITLGSIGSLIGMIPGVLLTWHFQVNPINYESMGEQFNSFEGLDAQIGTALTLEGAMMVFITGILVAVAASVYPAVIAVSKKPVEILRVTQ